MSSEQDKLLHCFRSVFPSESDSTLLQATPENVAQWDSANHFTLLQVIEDEFDVRISESAGGELLSFEAFEKYLRQHHKLG